VPEDGDKVSCLLTSSMICVLNSQATASVTITLQPDHRIIDTTLCYGTPYFAQGVWQTSGGTYYDTLATPLSCIRFIETHLGYKPSIPVDLGNDTVLCGNFITLWPHVPGGTYLWQDGSTDSVYVVTLPGKYKVLVGYDGCAQSDSIRIGECPVSIWFPNAFTPNGDGLNDTFHPVGRGIEKFSMQIFNRWGEIIYKKEKVEPGWDGTSQGNLCPEGTYIFKAVFETSDGAEKKVTGTVNLLR
jgi:gliding motility-associated-like protein